METNTVLWIVGIVVAIVLFYLGVRVTLKTNREVRLTYLENDLIPLFDAIVKNMEGIEITYEHNPVEPSLIMLKGCFLNNGNVDIDSKHIYQPVTITLPDNLVWKKVKVVETSPGVKITSRIIDNSGVEFSWDLLKKKECFKFDALIDASHYLMPGERLDKLPLSKGIIYSHRITDLDKVTTIHDMKIKPKNILIGVLLGLVFGALGGLADRTILAKKFTQYILEQPGKTPIPVRLIPQKNNLFKIKGIRVKYSAVVRADELNSSFKVTSPTSVLKIPNLITETILPGIMLTIFCAVGYAFF